MKTTIQLSLAAAVCCASLPATAGITFGEHVTVTGFGTLGLARTDTDEAQYRVDIRQDSGADRSADAGVDSKLGLQANVRFNDTFSGVAQLLTSRRLSHGTALEWLYGEAKLPAGFSVKLGRMVMPAFMVSDSRSVGYAAHWLRAPNQVYALYPYSAFDGGQLGYRSTFGPVNLTAQLSAGRAEEEVLFGGLNITSTARKLRSINLMLESGNWMVRYGRTTTRSSLTVLPVGELNETFTGYGLQYDNGTALVMAEYATRRIERTGLIDSDSFYLSAGWRFGKWMPYATVGNFKPKGALFGPIEDEQMRGIGLRWDAMPNVAVKVQVENYRSASGGFINQTPAFMMNNPKVRIVSAVVDFVF